VAATGGAHPLAVRRTYYLQRTCFEGIAERKLRRRQLTEDGNVEISGRDFAGRRPFGAGQRQTAAIMTVAPTVAPGPI